MEQISKFQHQYYKTTQKIQTISNEQNIDKSYALKLILSEDQQFMIAALSNLSIGIYQIANDGLKEIKIIQNAHDKRINDLFLVNNILYSCSNDSTIKIWDLGSYSHIKTFKKAPYEINSISVSNHILASATNSEKIVFWDLEKMKERSVFEETHQDEVTCVKFNQNSKTNLLASSMDGIICLYDLAQNSEEEATQFIMRLEQPLDRCNFFNSQNNSRFAYGITTVNSFSVIDMEQSKILKSVNAINKMDPITQQNLYLIDVLEQKQDNTLRYYLGKQSSNDGIIEEYILENNDFNTRSIYTTHTQIRSMCNLVNGNLISSGEEGTLQISTQTNEKPIPQQNTISLQQQQPQQQINISEQSIQQQQSSNQQSQIQVEQQENQVYLNPNKQKKKGFQSYEPF